MLNWLSQLPQWFQITFVFILYIMCICVILAILVPLIKSLIKKGITIKKGENSFVFGGDETALRICKNQGSEFCPFRKDLVIFLNESAKLFNEKHTITFVTQIKDQMNYTEQKLDQIRMKLHSIYLSELRASGASILVQNNSFIAYKYLLRDIQREILNKFRYFFRENHFNELSENDFTTYINSKFEYLVSELTDALNDMYYDDEFVTRERLYDLNTDYIPEIKPFIVEIFKYVRNVSIEYNLKLLELDEKIDLLVKKFIK